MRAIHIITFLLLLYTGSLLADISIRYDAITGTYKRPVHTLHIRQQHVRLGQSNDEQPAVIINLATGDITQLNPANKRFFVTNAQTLNQYVSFYRQNQSMLQGLIDHGLQQLNSSQRDQIQGLMKQFKKPETLSGIEIRPSTKTDQVLGANCRVISLYEQGLLRRDVCISDYRQLQLDAADIKSLQLLKQMLQQFSSSVANGQQDLLALMSDGFENIDGLPMKIVSYTVDGKVSEVIQAGAVSFRQIPPQIFSIPTTYQQQSMPIF